MDSLIAAAARALAAGDALGALKRVALRDDPPALALRGIAMAQLGEYPRARELLRRAARGFGAHEELARARCVVAEAEVALAMRDLRGSPRALAAAAATLEARGDRANALQARLIAVRRLLLLGRLDAAAAALDGHRHGGLPPALRGGGRTDHAPNWRCARCASARRERPSRARTRRPSAHACRRSLAEVAEARAALDRPAARRIARGGETDAAPRRGRGAARVGRAGRRRLPSRPARRRRWLPLARRPVLFALARALAEAWPGDVDRNALDRARVPHPPARTRRIGRVCASRSAACVRSSRRWRASRPPRAASCSSRATRATSSCWCRRSMAIRRRCVALLADGAAWSTSALALALGASQRTVQRALVELEAEGRVRSIGRARARRWLAPPLAGFTTILLLPAALPLE